MMLQSCVQSYLPHLHCYHSRSRRQSHRRPHFPVQLVFDVIAFIVVKTSNAKRIPPRKQTHNFMYS